MPRRYIFVAPYGAGNALSKLLRNPAALCSGLVAAWEKYCRRQITSKKEIVLDGALKAHVEGIDFSIFRAALPLRVLEEHRTTPWYVFRFGGGLPLREDPPMPPAAIGVHEANYVRALLDAYEDRLGSALRGTDDLADPPRRGSA